MIHYYSVICYFIDLFLIMLAMFSVKILLLIDCCKFICIFYIKLCILKKFLILLHSTFFSFFAVITSISPLWVK